MSVERMFHLNRQSFSLRSIGSFFKEHWAGLAIIATFVISHLLSIPLQLMMFKYFIARYEQLDAFAYTISYTMITINILAAVIIAIIISRKQNFWQVFQEPRMHPIASIGLGFVGFILAMIGQAVAAVIETKLFGIEPGSANTETLSVISQISPIMIISIVIFAPLLEEIVFRRAIFGGLYKMTHNFWLGAVVSGLLFAVVHWELEHLLMYLMPAFAFAFVYYISRSIIAPIAAHFFMNSFVTIVQLNYDKLEKYVEQTQNFIHWLH